jgi:hypothetical protein
MLLKRLQALDVHRYDISETLANDEYRTKKEFGVVQPIIENLSSAHAFHAK